MLYEATYNLLSMQRSISLYRALKKPRFSSTSPTRIFGDFWYVIEDMFLDQKPLKKPFFAVSGRLTDFSR